jgi:hypothetical protein
MKTCWGVEVQLYAIVTPILDGGEWPDSRSGNITLCVRDPRVTSSAEVKDRVELCLHSPNTLSWHGAQLKEQGQLYLYHKSPPEPIG